MKKIYLLFVSLSLTYAGYSQNVGINNDGTLPTEQLHVKSTLNAEHGILIESTLNNPIIQWKQGITTQFTLGVDNADADKLKLGTTSIAVNTRLTIDASGNVGIGTTAPAALFHVFRNSIATSGMIKLEQAGTGDAALKFTLPTQNFTIGIDNSDGDKFKIADNTTLTSLARLTIDATGNVGIGTTAPSASALLDLTSTTAGVLIPRMTTTQKNAIGTPATGLIVFDITLGAYYYYTGTAWIPFLDSQLGWALAGNALTTPGTDFIGTTDAQDLVFKTAGVERMRLDAAGNYLGIGTNNPTTALHVKGIGVSTSTLTLARYSANAFAGYIDFEKYRGTITTPAAIISGDITATIRGWGYDGTTLIENFSMAAFTAAAPAAGRIKTGFQLILDDGTALTNRWVISGDGTMQFGGNGLGLVGKNYTFNPTESTGVGQTSANYLSFGVDAVSGSELFLAYGRGSAVSRAVAQSGDLLGELGFGGFFDANTVSTSAFIASHATELYSPTTKGADLRFFTTANAAAGTFERMRIQQDGKIGMGLIAPTAKLQINSAVGEDGFRVQINGSTKLYVASNGGIAIANGTGAPTHIFHVNSNDVAKTSSGSWLAISDKRLKKNIEPFTDGLGVIEKLNPIWFKYNGVANTPTNEKGVGTVAQELMKIAPYMISPWEQTDEQGKTTIYYAVDYGAMDFVLVNAVKEQQKQIENMQQQIDALVKLNKVLIQAVNVSGKAPKMDYVQKYVPNKKISSKIQNYRMRDEINADFTITKSEPKKDADYSLESIPKKLPNIIQKVKKAVSPQKETEKESTPHKN